MSVIWCQLLVTELFQAGLMMSAIHRATLPALQKPNWSFYAHVVFRPDQSFSWTHRGDDLISFECCWLNLCKCKQVRHFNKNPENWVKVLSHSKRGLEKLPVESLRSRKDDGWIQVQQQVLRNRWLTLPCRLLNRLWRLCDNDIWTDLHSTVLNS